MLYNIRAVTTVTVLAILHCQKEFLFVIFEQ